MEHGIPPQRQAVHVICNYSTFMKRIWTFILGCFLCIDCTNSTSIKTEVPNIAGKQLNGNTINLQELAKNKVTLLSVWATFCGPCLEELVMLHNLYDSNKSNSQFAFMTLALNTTDELI
jgi:thiol-disulfide isomerase/thioredoxin